MQASAVRAVKGARDLSVSRGTSSRWPEQSDATSFLPPSRGAPRPRCVSSQPSVQRLPLRARRSLSTQAARVNLGGCRGPQARGARPARAPGFGVRAPARTPAHAGPLTARARAAGRAWPPNLHCAGARCSGSSPAGCQRPPSRRAVRAPAPRWAARSLPSVSTAAQPVPGVLSRFFWGGSVRECCSC